MPGTDTLSCESSSSSSAPSFYIYSLEAVVGVYISAAAVSGAVSLAGGATPHVAPSLLRSHQVCLQQPNGPRETAQCFGDQRAGKSSEPPGCYDVDGKRSRFGVRVKVSARSAAQMTENAASCSVNAAALASNNKESCTAVLPNS